MTLFEKILNVFWPIRPPKKIVTPISPTPAAVATAAPGHEDPTKARKWRLTHYIVSGQDGFSGPQTVPVFDLFGKKICSVEPAFFSNMSLQGTGKCRDGRLLNVTGKWVPVKHEDYSAVWEYHKKYLSKRAPGYSGLQVDGEKVKSAMAYSIIPPAKFGKGYGVLRGIPLEPFRTLAADIGLTARSEKKWAKKGGVCPALSKVFIKEFVGLKCPDGLGGEFVHDGWFVVNDTGGGIFGAHFDVFAGTKQLAAKVKIPHHATVWYDGIEERVPVGYSYGLEDK